MEKLLFTLVILLIVILIVLIGVVIFFLLKYLKMNNQQTETTERSKPSIHYQDKIPKELQEQIEAAKSVKDSITGQFCIDHPENPAKGRCSISNEAYCELCITREKDVRIARKHLHLFLDSEWENSFFVEDDKLGEDKIKLLMNLKTELWFQHSTPVITQKQFKINIETDEIETFTVVMTRPSDREVIDQKFQFLNQ